MGGARRGSLFASGRSKDQVEQETRQHTAAAKVQTAYRLLRITYLEFGPSIFCRQDGSKAPHGTLQLARGLGQPFGSTRRTEGRKNIGFSKDAFGCSLGQAWARAAPGLDQAGPGKAMRRAKGVVGLKES